MNEDYHLSPRLKRTHKLLRFAAILFIFIAAVRLFLTFEKKEKTVDPLIVSSTEQREKADPKSKQNKAEDTENYQNLLTLYGNPQSLDEEIEANPLPPDP